MVFRPLITIRLWTSRARMWRAPVQPSTISSIRTPSWWGEKRHFWIWDIAYSLLKWLSKNQPAVSTNHLNSFPAFIPSSPKHWHSNLTSLLQVNPVYPPKFSSDASQWDASVAFIMNFPSDNTISFSTTWVSLTVTKLETAVTSSKEVPSCLCRN